MNDLNLRFPRLTLPPERLPLGRILVNAGKITQADLVHALDLQRHVDSPLGEILVTEGLVRRHDLMRMLSIQHRVRMVDLVGSPPAPALRHRLPASLCLRHMVVPYAVSGDILLVCTAHPETFDALRACLGPQGRRIEPVLAHERDIRAAISRLYGAELAQKAARRVPAALSCRGWDVTNPNRRIAAIGLLAAGAASVILAPLWTITVLMVFAFVTLMMTTALKLAATVAQLFFPATPPPARAEPEAFPLPLVSVLVPLLREKEIAGKLIERLSRLTYPKSLLEVVLVLEADDHVTRETIARTAMPPWMSVIEVPGASGLTTKPRALNYALDFCRGSIIGVWDAEDAPESDQIEKIVTRFHSAPQNVACLQGVLDYYNARTNWLSRCFTIEYATWWRMILPGVARLGLVIPLGGTTLFFRRSVLEKLCGWDAHNVTEDADLGIRLARAGYVTELIATTTFEEANCKAWPWVKQRSRWLKGYLITWCVHMRDPAALMRDLGFLRFMGVQAILLATFAQFAAAPLLWSFWIMLIGISHPVSETLGSGIATGMAISFLIAEVINLSTSVLAVRGVGHRHLTGWVFTLPFYFPMGALSAYKALKELVSEPFYWDKTQHGVSQEENARALSSPPRDAQPLALTGS
ncbi:glycosyltransferase [Sulfitobacter albidus]|uniref:Glycosyltransferase n=1 Tax=Sulfitobacter albidus TaxID=2829501 RepID=A0A975PN84_9RHOB|nr:glycosyltransferase family 2 protein [Sulfitobacter albidus]QUJ77196.1 glycosyltransferase [Sulfitobacter albidus]